MEYNDDRVLIIILNTLEYSSYNTISTAIIMMLPSLYRRKTVLYSYQQSMNMSQLPERSSTPLVSTKMWLQLRMSMMMMML